MKHLCSKRAYIDEAYCLIDRDIPGVPTTSVVVDIDNESYERSKEHLIES